MRNNIWDLVRRTTLTLITKMKNEEYTSYLIKDETAMQQLGAQLSSICSNHCILYLEGDLGAGKTTLVRGFLRALGYTEKVKSPTYTLVEHYLLNDRDIYHFDLYRLTDPSELEYIGIRDYFVKKGIFLIEWPEHGKNFLPPADITCKITIIKNERNVEIFKKKHT